MPDRLARRGDHIDLIVRHPRVFDDTIRRCSEQFAEDEVEVTDLFDACFVLVEQGVDPRTDLFGKRIAAEADLLDSSPTGPGR